MLVFDITTRQPFFLYIAFFDNYSLEKSDFFYKYRTHCFGNLQRSWMLNINFYMDCNKIEKQLWTNSTTLKQGRFKWCRDVVNGNQIDSLEQMWILPLDNAIRLKFNYKLTTMKYCRDKWIELWESFARY